MPFFLNQFVSADAMPLLSPLGEIKHKGEICAYYRFMFHSKMSVLPKYLEHNYCPYVVPGLCSRSISSQNSVFCKILSFWDFYMINKDSEKLY